MPLTFNAVREIDANVDDVAAKHSRLATELNERALTPGDCNRLNDFVHDLQASLHNLEKRLTAGGRSNDYRPIMSDRAEREHERRSLGGEA